MAVPALLYGSEHWTLTKSQEQRIEASEMRFLRSVAGYTIADRKRSEDIRTELNIFRLMDKITQYREEWLQHINRMDNNRIPKRILHYKPSGRRNVGRPYKRWTDQF